ncbi:MAG: ornithine carbamoyltransferase [Deltaproteobacteria bacterium]|nr:ornithine carbamoyltransferase [Deltaproteobacteria bacterium]
MPQKTKKDFIAISDFSKKELLSFLELAKKLKKAHRKGKDKPLLRGKSLGMIFQKSSTRTRVSFESGMIQLGGHALFLSSNDIQIGRGETIADTARVLSRYVDGIMARTYKHQDVLDLAKYATVPVINGLTDFNHPCQALTDVFTVLEKKTSFRKLKFVYIGDGNNMVHSLLSACSKLGINIVVCTPPNYKPSNEVVEEAKKYAQKNNSSISLVEEPWGAIKDADVVYTDTWASMGQEAEHEKRLVAFRNYQIDKDLVKHAKKDHIVMHCLPAHRGEEITSDVLDGPNSVIFDQAENRMHVQKAILVKLMS